MSITDAIRRFSEAPETFTYDPPLPARRIQRPSFTLVLSPSPTQSLVCSVQTTEQDLDGTIAEIRGLLREAGYSRVVWNIGASCRPEGLPSLLAERGFVPATAEPYEPTTTAMALGHAPEGRPSGVEARRAANLDEFVQAVEIAIEAFGMTGSDADGWRSAAPTLWAQQDGVHRFVHLAFLGGQPVGFGFNVSGPEGLLLGGSGVRPSARGHGAYRALLAARWEDAVALGKPALVVQAGAMSRPILERCGFEAVCRLDHFDDAPFSRSVAQAP